MFTSLQELIDFKKQWDFVDSNLTIPRSQKNRALESLIENTVKKFSNTPKYYTALAKDKISYENEFLRLLNLDRYNQAINEQAATYKSFTACSKEGCGNYVRYASNKGCIACQNAKCTMKVEKLNRAHEILKKLVHTPKSAIIKLLMAELEIKRSAAYNLIDKFMAGDAVFKVPQQPSHEIDEYDPYAYKKEMNSTQYDEFDLNQDHDMYEWEVA